MADPIRCPTHPSRITPFRKLDAQRDSTMALLKGAYRARCCKPVLDQKSGRRPPLHSGGNHHDGAADGRHLSWLLQAYQRRIRGPQDQMATLYWTHALPFAELLWYQCNRKLCNTFWKRFEAHLVLQNYYSPDIFRSVGITSTDTIYLTTGIFGVVKTSITILWLTILVDKWGRRQLLIYGAIAGSCCMFIIGALITARVSSGDTQSTHLSSEGIATVFMVYLWTAVYVNSWNGTPWVINAEMFNQRTRNVGQVSASMANWLWTFIIARITPDMINGMGTSGFGMYFFFGSVTICALGFVWFLVPETKSVPLDKMDRLFEIRPRRIAQPTVMKELQSENLDRDVMIGKLSMSEQRE